MTRVVLAIHDRELTARATILLEESDDLEVLATATEAGQVLTQLDEVEPDVVVLHEELGPLPVLDLARDINHRFPQVGVVMIAEDQSSELLRAAMGVGVRAVVPVPLTLSEFHGAVAAAAEWARAVQERLARSGDAELDRFRGRMVGLGGAKGGVGTSTVAVQLALALQRSEPQRSVCLVDLDLQKGDVRSYLDLAHQRGITDLIDVASELTTAHLREAMFVHATGLHVLLPPTRGEYAEDLDDATTARILGGIRARFDLVVLDLGAVVNEATAAAAELADEILVVTTPDVVALRGANRLIGLWERLRVRDRGVRVLLNQTSRDREVTPQLAERVVRAPLLDTTVPAAFEALEAAVNTGVPERIDGPVRGAMERLAREVLGSERSDAASPQGPPPGGRTTEERLAASEAGTVTVDFVGMMAAMVLTVALLWQFALAGFTVVVGQNAAREAARTLAVSGPDDPAVVQMAEDRLLPAWRGDAGVVVAPERVTVSLTVPLLMPGLGGPWRLSFEGHTVAETGMGG